MIQFSEPMEDCMNGCERWTKQVNEHGSVSLVDVMPRFKPVGKTADFAICQAARVSYGIGTKKTSEDTGLIRYLLRNDHTTPFEMIEFKFHCVMPIFVARQWIRHRTASVNEYSARYSIVEDKFYRPDTLRSQSTTNKQGSENILEEEDVDYFEPIEKQTYAAYNDMLEKGVSRELARIVLPLSTYTEWYWKINLHNLFRFLRLRMDEHAQFEIQQYAKSMFELIQPIVPIACNAFKDYQLFSIRLSRLELEALKNNEPLETTNTREKTEYEQKLLLLSK